MNEKKWGKAVCFLFAELLFLFIAIIIYRYRMNSFYDNPIEAGFKWAHKTNYEYVLSADNSSVSEEIVLDFPDIQNIAINGSIIDVTSDAVIAATVTHLESGTVLSDVSVPVSKAFDEDGKSLKIKFKNNEYSGGEYRVDVQLQNPGNTSVSLVANTKPGLVTSFNGSTEEKLNIITRVRFGSVRMISGLFIIVIVLMMIFIGLIYLWIDLHDIKKLFPALMITLGIAFQIIVPVGGVPDESWHIDTAYKYSNMMMGIDDSANPGTIFKRRCDVIESDMLGNNMESNSYYQLMNGIFRRAKDTELMEVGFMDTSNQVFGIVYFPMALGITVGRLFGVSGITVYVLGRIFSFAVYAMLMYLAIVLMPFGKNVTALIAMLPISLQQGGSASYDSMIIGAGAVFAAMVLRSLSDSYKAKWWEIALFAVSGILVVSSKGGVYAPVILVGAYFFFLKGRISGFKFKENIWIVLGLTGALIAVGIALFFIYKDTILSVAGANSTGYGEESYSVAYIISNPGWFLQVIGNTIVEKFDDYFLGFMGGYLGWQTIKLGMVYAIPMFMIAMLMANAEGDSIKAFKCERVALLLSMCCSIFLVLLGMFLADTAFGEEVILGVQGRYFLPFATFLFLTLGNHLISVSDKDVKKLWKIGVFVEAVAVLQVIVYAWE